MLDVERLLADCLQDIRGVPRGTVPVDSASPEYEAARRTFLSAGLSALRDDRPEDGWVQINLAPTQATWRRTYRAVAETARDLIAAGSARSFFFMHKPPGLRVRFEAGRSDSEALCEELLRRFPGVDGRSGPPLCGRYEPETYLFGGLRSMRYVHDLFTVDSLAWLDHHDAVAAPGRLEAVADWRFSLYLLGELLDGLGIVGWEHRGVWQVLRDDIGRRLGTDPGEDARRAAAGILAVWRSRGPDLLAPLPPQRRAAAEAHGNAVRRAAEAWRTGYFESGEAVLGPRRAAAHYVVFHWNRGRLSLARQSLLTHALAGDGGF
ncbi:thiopeptide-type bacteriocin biosynthesis protein [Kitasatospora aureofaciens]|uniref:thiopeptide-type bacteriocin biosynthesis protein n=1 Tax=Kitasatospora aureofaciens TaxID=1894 RepID=UPI0037C9CD66